MVETALKTTCSPIYVVLGADATSIQSTLNYPGIRIIHHPDWQEGMASSIRAAVRVIQEIEEVGGMVILLCDQPFVTPALIDKLVYKSEEAQKPVVACAYEGSMGVPVFFSRSLFHELQILTGQQGAKKILERDPNDIATVIFEKGGTDIDTMADYECLLRRANNLL